MVLIKDDERRGDRSTIRIDFSHPGRGTTNEERGCLEPRHPRSVESGLRGEEALQALANLAPAHRELLLADDDEGHREDEPNCG